LGRKYFVKVLYEQFFVELGLQIGLEFGLDLSREVFNPDQGQDLDILVEEFLVFEVIGVKRHCLDELHNVFRDGVKALLKNSRVIDQFSSYAEKLLGIFAFFYLGKS